MEYYESYYMNEYELICFEHAMASLENVEVEREGGIALRRVNGNISLPVETTYHVGNGKWTNMRVELKEASREEMARYNARYCITCILDEDSLEEHRIVVASIVDRMKLSNKVF